MLRIHRAERADRLVDGLASVLADPLADPLTPETIAVPTRGVERWLVQRLSMSLGASPAGGDGVCANVDFPFPGRLVAGAVAAATGVDAGSDPWLPERSVWPLLEVVDGCMGERWLAPLAAHLGVGGGFDDDGATGGEHADGGWRDGRGSRDHVAAGGDGADRHRRTRRFTVVRHVADLFDRYGVHRPAMLRAWAAGRDTGESGAPLPPDLAWQPRLWRALRARVATPSPPERLADACARLRVDTAALDLPARLSLFGLTRLPASYLDVLHAIAAGRDVHLFLLHPSPALWARIDASLGRPRTVASRAADTTARLPRNPLLATWGRDAREMQLVLTAEDRPPHTDAHHPLGEEATTLLGRIQADVRADRAPPGPAVGADADARPLLDPADRSLQVHACHGRARQVEVARDAILHLLADDPTLEPRDVIVMCPDIDAFAPLIHATFGAAGADGGRTQPGGTDAGPGGGDRFAASGRGSGLPDLRARLADRSIRQTNPVLGAAAQLLALADGRLTASEVVDFASREPVRRRFRFDDDDLARIEDWVEASGVRWGLDAAHRAPWGLDTVEANTWRAGLDRVLVGVSMAEDRLRLVGGVLPLDDVGSADIDLAGRLSELLDRLAAAAGALSPAARKPFAAWAAAIATAVDALCATGDDDAWQRAQLQQLLDDVVAEATPEGGHPCATPLALAEVRSLLADRLRGRPTRANFRTGHLTMCTLVPMRSVPHRVVCLLGLDDGVFPRRTAPDGDDLVERDPWVGDRDPRSEDRQLLLDALLAATDHLVVTYAGRDERTNAVRPPAVPVGELLDVVDATVRTGPGPGAPAARERVVVHHPLQPFDARNFVAGHLAAGPPWSFDAVALEGARAATGPRSAPPAFLPGPLPPAVGDLVELDDLVAFVQHPVKAFLRQRLGVSTRSGGDDPSDALPVELDNLERWQVGDRLLENRLAGVDEERCLAAERARGSLPPGALGRPLLDDHIAPDVDALVAVAAAHGGTAEAVSVDVHVDLGGGRTLAGTVPVLGDVVRAVTYSTLAPKHRLGAWARLLALTATHPHRTFRAATVGRGGRDCAVKVAVVPALGTTDADRRRAALERLAVLVDLYDRGMREPLPLYCRTSAAWAEARAAGREPEARARREWESEHERAKEDKELEHQRVLGGVRRFDELLEAGPRADESGPGWAGDEPSRFGRYARRLWDGLLAHEQVGPG